MANISWSFQRTLQWGSYNPSTRHWSQLQSCRWFQVLPREYRKDEVRCYRSLISFVPPSILFQTHMGHRLIVATKSLLLYASGLSMKSPGACSVGMAINGTRLSVGLNQTIFGRVSGSSFLALSPSLSRRSSSCFSFVAAEDGRRTPSCPENNCPGIRST